MLESLESNVNRKMALIMSPEQYEEKFRENIEMLSSAVDEGDTEAIARIGFYIEKHENEISEFKESVLEINDDLESESLSEASKAILVENKILIEKILKNLQRYVHEYHEILSQNNGEFSNEENQITDSGVNEKVTSSYSELSPKYSLAEIQQYRKILKEGVEQNSPHVLDLLEGTVVKYTEQVTKYEIAISEIDALLKREGNSEVSIALYTNNKMLLEQAIVEIQELIADYQELLTSEIESSVASQ